MFKIIPLLSLILLSACTTLPTQKMKDAPEFAPIEPVEPAIDVIVSGSLYQDLYSNNLYSDKKARRIGDIITILLEESTTAKKTAGSSKGKENAYNLGVDPSVIPGFSTQFTKGGASIGLNSKSKFKGAADAAQSNSLKGSITVNVTRVLNNGNLEIRGEKWLMLNNGEEFVRIKGLIRSEDVSSDNTISSKRVANARIQYGGTGDFANTQEQGWLTSFFNGPYWPF